MKKNRSKKKPNLAAITVSLNKKTEVMLPFLLLSSQERI